MPEVTDQDVDSRTATVLRNTRDDDFDTVCARWEEAVAVVRAADATHETLPWYGNVTPTSIVLAFRAFETWTHAGDIATALGGQRRSLSGETFHTMADLSIGLMPGALAAAGAARAGCARIVLTGEGGGTWTIPLAPDGSPIGEPVFELVAPIHEWCLRIGDRVEVADMPLQISGDQELARQLVTSANAYATL